MTRPIKLKCNTCDYEFFAKQHVEKLGDAVERWYFECPKCCKHSTICYIDNDIRFLQKLQKSAIEARNHKEHQRLTEKIEKAMDVLKLKYESGAK